MKTFTLCFALVFCSLNVQAQKFSTAIEYNDYIVEQQNSIASAMLIFNEGLNSLSATKENAMENLNGLKTATKTGLEKVRKMSAFEGNTSLREATIDLFSFYETTFANEYAQLVDLLFKDDLNDDILAEMERLLAKITESEKVLDENFASEQKAFAVTHGFELTTNEWQEKLNEE